MRALRTKVVIEYMDILELDYSVHSHGILHLVYACIEAWLEIHCQAILKRVFLGTRFLCDISLNNKMALAYLYFDIFSGRRPSRRPYRVFICTNVTSESYFTIKRTA